MEMGIVVTVIMSALSALCSVACLVILLVASAPKEETNVFSPALEKTEKPPDTPENVEKRRRVAVQAKEHSNFINYDGTPQQPIDPNTILGEG